MKLIFEYFRVGDQIARRFRVQDRFGPTIQAAEQRVTFDAHLLEQHPRLRRVRAPFEYSTIVLSLDKAFGRLGEWEYRGFWALP